ncbi:shikimate kinase [Streptomyces atrovirens]|uniref:Shikimate kinase n=1 Tax=Streptomyces atrovirens TaxID=285556 RepID=A0ABW0E373_9ACTN
MKRVAVTTPESLPARLRHVYWIGGGSGAGKSTISRRLADRHGWRLYATDEVMQEHTARTTSAQAPSCTGSWPWTWTSDG